MIDARSRAPIRDAVTGLTNIRRGDMCGVLPRCRHTVVARSAVADDTGVIEMRLGPGRRCVAIVALGRGRNMGRTFSACKSIVVTA